MESTETSLIGRVERLRRYPVKSMRGEDLEEAIVSSSGVAGDRVYAFADPAKKTDFPWVTARQVPEMLLFRPRFPSPGAWRVEVETPEGERRDIEDPAFKAILEARWKRPLVLRFSQRGIPDAYPLSVFGLATVRELSRETGLDLDLLRFRANLYVEWSSPEPFLEETLVGKTLKVGKEFRLLVESKDPRCVIINLDPGTSRASPEVLKTVARRHGGEAGVYASVIEPGVVRRGDPIFLLD